MKTIQNLTDDFRKQFDQRSPGSSRIKHQFQVIGLELSRLLNDKKNISLYMKIAKQNKNFGQLLHHAKKIREDKRIENKGAYFMSIVFEKKSTL